MRHDGGRSPAGADRSYPQFFLRTATFDMLRGGNVDYTECVVVRLGSARAKV
jgi:hypothetical protein